MNTGFVSKCIASDDRLVGLHRNSGDLAQHLARREELLTHDLGLIHVAIGTNACRHHNLFQRSIPSALADPVDGAFHLTCPGGHGGQRVCYGQSQIVMAVRRDGDFFNSRHTLADRLNQLAEFRGHAIPNRVRNVHRGGTSFDNSLHNLE